MFYFYQAKNHIHPDFKNDTTQKSKFSKEGKHYFST